MTIYTTPEAFEDPTPSLGQSLGQSFGTSIGSGLQVLVKDRLEKMKQARLQDLLKDFATKEEGEYSPEQLVVMEQMVPGSSKIYQEAAKKKQEQIKTSQEKEGLSNVFSELESLNEFTGPIKYLKSLDPEVRKNRQKYDSLGLVLEKRGAGMVGKGTLSKPRFEFLRKRLPSSTKTQASNEGAIEAWREILDVEKSPQKITEKFQLEKVPVGTPLTKEVVEDLKNRGYNQEEAKQIAKKLGYEF